MGKDFSIEINGLRTLVGRPKAGKSSRNDEYSKKNGCMDEDVPHFVILTKPANAVMQPVHDRMPVMVREEDIDAWLLDASRTKDLLESEVPLERIQAVEEFSLF